MRTVLLSLVALALLAGSVRAGDGDVPVTFSFVDEDVRKVLTTLSEYGDLTVEIEDGVEGRVTLELRRVPARDALRATAAAVGCEAVKKKTGGVTVRPRKGAAPVRRVTFEFPNEDVRKVIQALCAYAQANYVLAPDVQGRITLSVQRKPWRETLDAVLRAVGARARALPGNVLLLERVPPSGEPMPILPITFQFPNEEVANIVQATCGYAQASVVFSDALKGKVGLSVSAVPWPDALDATVLAAGAERVDLPGGILLVQPLAARQGVASRAGVPKKVSFRFEGEDVRRVLFAIATYAKLNVAMAPDVTGNIDFSAEQEPALACLKRAAAEAGLTVTEHRPGVFVVRKGP